MDMQQQEEKEKEKVIRLSKGLVKPSSGTPSGMLDLSGIDKLAVLRCNARTLHVFKYGPSAASAARVIKKALAEALVPYYPLAGRLKFNNTNDDSNNISFCIQGVDCNAQGIWFVEASAPNCTLKSLNYFEDDRHASLYASLLPDHPPTTHAHDDPLVLMQVTQYACGGFVMGLTFCHSICDGLGAAQFLQAVGEIARKIQPSVVPVWHRHFLHMNQQQPKPAAIDHQQPPLILLLDDEKELQHANIDIPLDDIIHLKQKFHDSTGGLTCSSFEIAAAMLWKNRTLAIVANNNNNNNRSDDHEKQQQEEEEEVKMMMKLVFFANCRGLVQPPLPKGFYGNCFFPMTITESSKTLNEASIDDVVKLIQHAKTKLLPLEFNKWINGQLEGEMDPFAPPTSMECYNTLFVSEWGRLGFNEVDYGWGPPIHVVPIQGSAIIPVAIVTRPTKAGGIRLMTWCLQNSHFQPFLHHMNIMIKMMSSS